MEGQVHNQVGVCERYGRIGAGRAVSRSGVNDMNGPLEKRTDCREPVPERTNSMVPVFGRHMAGKSTTTRYIAWGPVNYSVDEFRFLLMAECQRTTRVHDDKT